MELATVQFLESATAIAAAYPKAEDRFRYKKLIDAVKAIQSRTPEIVRADIESQAALADAIDEALAAGEVKAERNGKGQPVYQLGKQELHGAEVDRWRKLRAIPEQDRQSYYEQTAKPSRNALLKWWSEQCIEAGAFSEESKSASGEKGDVKWSFQLGTCKSLPFADDTFDLVFCSPPYESQRAYTEVGFALSGDEYVQWAADCFMECLRVCKGLVAWVVEGVTQNFSYSYTPFLIGAEVQRRGGRLRKPVVYQRNGIPGTGGPDFFRNDWEPIICATKNGRLPWSDNTAMGQPPKQNKPRKATNRYKDGTRKDFTYNDPDIANPGNVIKGLVGCGGLGWKDAHKNEAPFPELLAEFFIKSFCPPGGHVLDPFSGSGTTVAVAVGNGRSGTGVDVRESQIWLGETRLMGMSVAERHQGQEMLC